VVIASLLTTLAAFGIGGSIGNGAAPDHRITQTAQMIGNENDFTRRVAPRTERRDRAAGDDLN
jgi:hypothetical protein